MHPQEGEFGSLEIVKSTTKCAPNRAWLFPIPQSKSDMYDPQMQYWRYFLLSSVAAAIVRLCEKLNQARAKTLNWEFYLDWQLTQIRIELVLMEYQIHNSVSRMYVE